MNADIEIVDINSLQDFLDQINELQEKKGFEKIWFRGVADEFYGLEPSIYRRADNPVVEKQLLNRFKTRALPFIEDKGEKKY